MSMFLASMILSPVAHAGSFNMHNILSDYELEDYASLSQNGIQRFLEQKNSFLAHFTEVVNGVRKSASEIIYSEAQLYRVSPKIILAMLQKEQSLITDQSPSQNQLDWAMGFGVCDSCSKNDPALAPLKGFYNQVSSFAEKIRVNYLRDLNARGFTYTGWGPYRTKTTLDGFEVTPVNNATAILYTYNPWRGSEVGIGANYNFWKIWNRYFIRSYPDGTLLQVVGEPGVWLLQKGKRRAFMSRASLVSRYDVSKIIHVSQNELDKYENGTPIKFTNYSLLRAPWGTIYLLVDDTVRGIASREVFRTIGFNPEEVISVSADDIRLYTEGAPITINDTYPTGALLQNNTSGAVYFVQNGIRHGITDRTIMDINFPRQKPIPIHPDELAQYPDGTRETLADGTIVTAAGNPAVYVIAGGKRRPVVSGDAFEELGYRWSDVRVVPQHVVDLHAPAEPLDVIALD